MVTIIKEKFLEFIDDIYSVFIMVLLFPFFIFLWMVSLIKGVDLLGIEI